MFLQPSSHPWQKFDIALEIGKGQCPDLLLFEQHLTHDKGAG